MSATIDDVYDAHQACEQAARDMEAAVAERARVVRAALAAGAGAQPIADALEVSRQRVYQMAKQG
jgi:FixJ family two-component response regulator